MKKINLIMIAVASIVTMTACSNTRTVYETRDGKHSTSAVYHSSAPASVVGSASATSSVSEASTPSSNSVSNQSTGASSSSESNSVAPSHDAGASSSSSNASSTGATNSNDNSAASNAGNADSGNTASAGSSSSTNSNNNSSTSNDNGNASSSNANSSGSSAGVVYGNWTAVYKTSYHVITKADSLDNGKSVKSTTLTGYTRTITTTTLSSYTTSSTTDAVITTTVIPYMRAITITVKGSGFRPYTRIYPWFSNTNVTAYCKPNGGVVGGNLVTNSAGDITLYFYVPNNSTKKFATGSNTFVLCDNATTPSNSDLRTTYGEAEFLSGGYVQTRTQTTVQTTYVSASTTTTYEYKKKDPIAQTFTVDKKNGLFVDGVDIYFKTKDTTLPVTLEIRETIGVLMLTVLPSSCQRLCI